MYRLLEAGLDYLHLRKKHWTRLQTERFLQYLPDELHGRIVLHRYPELLHEWQLGGFHGALSTTHLPAKCRRGCSVHTYDEYMNYYDSYDYLWLGPFFNSYSKLGYASNPELWHMPPQCVTDKLVAVGGIDPGRLSYIYRLGIRQVAVLGYIWQNPNPLKAWQQLQQVALSLNQP